MTLEVKHLTCVTHTSIVKQPTEIYFLDKEQR